MFAEPRYNFGMHVMLPALMLLIAWAWLPTHVPTRWLFDDTALRTL
jgi:hypothetical protein